MMFLNCIWKLALIQVSSMFNWLSHCSRCKQSCIWSRDLQHTLWAYHQINHFFSISSVFIIHVQFLLCSRALYSPFKMHGFGWDFSSTSSLLHCCLFVSWSLFSLQVFLQLIFLMFFCIFSCLHLKVIVALILLLFVWWQLCSSASLLLLKLWFNLNHVSLISLCSYCFSFWDDSLLIHI